MPQPLDTEFWGIQLRGIFTGGKIQFEPWDIDQAHHFNLFAAKVLGGEVVSTLISLLPSLRAKGAKRAELQQVSLLERADHIREAMINALHSQALFKLLQGVDIAQSGGAVPLADPSPDLSASFGGMPVTEATAPAMDIWLPLWGVTGGVAVPRKDALWNKSLASVWDLYKLVGAVIAENLFPLDHGQRALRDSLHKSQKGLRWVAHTTLYVGDPREIMEMLAGLINPNHSPGKTAQTTTPATPRPLEP